jgi:hypothetical protein
VFLRREEETPALVVGDDRAEDDHNVQIVDDEVAPFWWTSQLFGLG